MDSSGLFNQKELSDVVLRLVIVEMVEDPPTGSLKRVRSAEPDETRLLFLHKFALYASPYFKSRLQRWEALAAVDALPEGQGPSSSTSRSELVEQVLIREGESLAAAEIALKCLYGGGLPGSMLLFEARLLLQAYCMADKFKVPAPCMEPIVAALSALPTEALDLAMLSETFCMPRELLQAVPLRPLLRACVERLVQLFGDVPDVIVDEGGLRQQFCALPFAAVRMWARSDKLKVHLKGWWRSCCTCIVVHGLPVHALS